MNKGLKDDSSNFDNCDELLVFLKSLDKTMNKLNKTMNDKFDKLDKTMNEMNNKLDKLDKTMNKLNTTMNDKLDKLNKTMNDRFDELSLSINLIETGSGKNDIFDFLAQEGGVGPGIEESFSMENSMDSSDLDELPDEVYRYEDY